MQDGSYSSVLGTSIQTAEIDNNAVTAAKIAAGALDMELVHSGLVSTTNATEEEVDAFTATAGQFEKGDTILVVVDQDHSSNSGVNKLKIADSGASITLTDWGTSTAQTGFMVEARITQDPRTSTRAHIWQRHFSNTTNAENNNTGAMNDTDWITTAWTLSLRASVTGTKSFSWKIYRIKGASA